MPVDAPLIFEENYCLALVFGQCETIIFFKKIACLSAAIWLDLLGRTPRRSLSQILVILTPQRSSWKTLDTIVAWR